MRVWIESAAGTVALTVNGQGDLGPVLLGSETEGLGLASVDASFSGGAAPGSRLTGVAVKEQDGVLHLVVRHPSVAERRRLLRLVADAVRYRDLAPLPRLCVELDDGSVFEREFVSGGAGSSSVSAGASLSVPLLLEVAFPHPYWRAREAVQFVLEPSTDAALLPEFDRQRVVDGAGAESRLVTNSGSVSVPMRWRFEGPCGSGAHALIGGVGFSLRVPLGVGESVDVIVSAQGVRVVDQAGANAFSKLGPDAEFPWLPDLPVQVELLLPAAVPGVSRIVGAYWPEVEVVH